MLLKVSMSTYLLEAAIHELKGFSTRGFLELGEKPRNREELLARLLRRSNPGAEKRSGSRDRRGRTTRRIARFKRENREKLEMQRQYHADSRLQLTPSSGQRLLGLVQRS